MSLFRSKIDPFSCYTINLGPLYLERVFDSLLTRQGIQQVVLISAKERFERYLDYLKKRTDPGNRVQYGVIQFYKGHFYQQLAAHSAQYETVQHFQEKALCYYQTYLEFPDRQDESRYYAHWQIGMLQYMLKYPWQQSENSLLEAGAIDPVRGEALKKIVDHYMQIKDWENAYRHSSAAVKSFFDKNPVAHRRWFVDLNAYNWNVINTHLIICYKLGYLREAGKAYDQMVSYEMTHLNEFKNFEIRHIHTLKRLFHKNLNNGTSSNKTKPQHSEL
jgi:hypothetical protein